MARDYAAAIEALNSLQSNASIVEAIRKSGGAMNQNAIPEMIGWCRRLGYEPEDFNKLNVIHIAGTKGKGSTAAFISSILEQYIPKSDESTTPRAASETSPYPNMVGLYTSPHLRSVRERIRINGRPLSETTFARFFFETWDRLEASIGTESTSTTPGAPAQSSSIDPATDPATMTHTNPRPKPVYFRYLTLMALHTYLTLSSPCPTLASTSSSNTAQPSQTQTNTALILETGVGGTHDSTNIIPSPLITAITALALDHTALLGTTLPSIAHHKSGIFKSASPHRDVYTVPQPPKAMAVLHKRAADAGKTLRVVPVHPVIASGAAKLGLDGAFQAQNASLAIAVVAAWLRQRGAKGIPAPLSADPLPEDFKRGLQQTRWGGRCETRADPVLGEARLMWYLDGGHTVESVALAGEWFGDRMRGLRSRSGGEVDGKRGGGGRRILLFNQQTRDATALARALHTALSGALAPLISSSTDNTTIASPKPLFTHAIFSTNVTYASTGDSTGRYKPDLISINTAASVVSGLQVQKELAGVWGELEAQDSAMEEAETNRGDEKSAKTCDVRVCGSISEAVDLVRSIVGDSNEKREGNVEEEEQDRQEATSVFVTGSLHLVGGVLEVLSAGDSDSDSETVRDVG